MLTSEIIDDLISSWELSKKRNDMLISEKYYAYHNDILNKVYNEYDIDGEKVIDENKSNEHMVNTHYPFGIDQKIGYLLGKPLNITSKKAEDKTSADIFIDAVGNLFNVDMIEYSTEASINGVSYLHPYVKKGGKLGLKVYDTKEIILILDTEHEDEILSYIHYYPMESTDKIGNKIYRNRVEHWTDTEVYIYQEQFDKGVYELVNELELGMPNPQPHWYTWSTYGIDGIPTNEQAHSWGKPPIIQLKNNIKATNDLTKIKRYIDAIDLVSSGYINDLADIQLVFWVLRGYEGQDLREFMVNLIKYKAIAVGEDGGVEPKSIEIPFEASTELIKWCESKIYTLGEIANIEEMKSGNITNTMIKAIYSGLNNKTSRLSVFLGVALTELAYFVNEFTTVVDSMSFDYTQLQFQFNLSTIMNEKERVETIQSTVGTLSKKTRIKLLPFDIDVEAELKLLEEEEASSYIDLEEE